MGQQSAIHLVPGIIAHKEVFENLGCLKYSAMRINRCKFFPSGLI